MQFSEFKATFSAHTPHQASYIEKWFGVQCRVGHSKPGDAPPPTQFSSYKGKLIYTVCSGKYNLRLYFESGTKENDCLRLLLPNMSEIQVEQPLHLPLLRLFDQVMCLTDAVSKLQTDAAETRAEMEEMKARLLRIEHRDRSPTQK